MYCTVVTMVKIQFLTILLVVTCFLGGVVFVTYKEFEVSTSTVVAMVKIQFLTILLVVTFFPGRCHTHQ